MYDYKAKHYFSPTYTVDSNIGYVIFERKEGAKESRIEKLGL